jgi:hypothetical protein
VYAPSAAEGRAWNSASSRAEEARRAARRRPFLRAIAVETGDREGRRCRWAMSRLPCARAKRLNKRSWRRMDESAESTETAVRARATARGTETLTSQCSRARLARYSFRPAPPRPAVHPAGSSVCLTISVQALACTASFSFHWTPASRVTRCRPRI